MFKSYKNKFQIILYINVFMIFLNIIILYFAKNSSNLVENFYSRKLFLYISKPLSYFSNYFSFSLGELTIALALILLIALFVFFMYFLIIKKWKKTIMSILLIVFVLLFNLSYYQLAWGLNNYRQDVENIFKIED